MVAAGFLVIVERKNKHSKKIAVALLIITASTAKQLIFGSSSANVMALLIITASTAKQLIFGSSSANVIALFKIT